MFIYIKRSYTTLLSRWKSRPIQFPVDSYRTLPTGAPKQLPKVQHEFKAESPDEKAAREKKQLAVKQVFQKCWASYKEKAWMQDELEPISGGAKNTFGGWAATLVDSLDTLWIMDLKTEFDEAVSAAINIDFDAPPGEINVFETTIRYLGGFMSAYDLSSDVRLLRKAIEVGEMLYAAFDTPNRMPLTRWDAQQALTGTRQEAHENTLVAEIGSLVMEFTRLSQLTKDMKWFDAVQRITEIFAAQQMETLLPGMWPIVVNAKEANFSTNGPFTLSAMADSVYEYLPKTFALLGGLDQTYHAMYKQSMHAAKQHILFRPMLPDNADILISGNAVASPTSINLDPEGQHLGCFVGGMFALGGRLFDIPAHVEIGKKATDGCIWAYNNSPLGIMPEKFTMTPCHSTTDCKWDEAHYMREVAQRNLNHKGEQQSATNVIQKEKLPLGFTSAKDKRYILRPEAIESVFILYRITGEKHFRETAWKMFTAIQKNTETELANAALSDVLVKENPHKVGSMESFWLAETLKYFYLIFSEPDLISLDEYVFNTEAHPFKRPS
ncbi:glycoside hydrolase family 47 protein [Rhizodiscina lignyota]|uniref:alpha-1,2-Mannosidase n=1 Tax=Rhizodiscina lignyota TaxID=1504668 RepID=A0A9P4IRV7_9PEZI|nr:glycoside hydrolase family 47 protein [Rhizodiscina lignyota]